MEQRILAFAGRKQSGKDSAADFVTGYELRQRGVIRKFQVDESGLWVNASVSDGNGGVTEEMGLLDLKRTDSEFLDYVHQNVYPYVRSYSFATALKWIAIEVFGLSFSSVFGTDSEKNEPTHILWSSILAFCDEETLNDAIANPDNYTGFISGRDFLKIFGSDICRKIFNDCWTGNTMRNINRDMAPLVLITDLRFPNELDAVKQAGGKIIKLTRRISEDTHISEKALDHLKDSDFDGIIDNQGMDIQEKNDSIYQFLLGWNWIGGTV